MNLGDFARPSSREIDRWSDKEGEVLIRTRASNLLVEFERFPGQVSAHVEQYPVIQIGTPEKSGTAEIFGRVYLDAMILQNPDPNVAGRLVAVNEKNGLALKNWLATKWWWAIHTAPPKGKRNLGGLSSCGMRESRGNSNWQSAVKTIMTAQSILRKKVCSTGTTERLNALSPSRCLTRIACRNVHQYVLSP
jgi:hypothetical protein